MRNVSTINIVNQSLSVLCVENIDKGNYVHPTFTSHDSNNCGCNGKIVSVAFLADIMTHLIGFEIYLVIDNVISL